MDPTEIIWFLHQAIPEVLLDYTVKEPVLLFWFKPVTIKFSITCNPKVLIETPGLNDIRHTNVIQQVFFKHPPYARHCASLWSIQSEKQV